MLFSVDYFLHFGTYTGQVSTIHSFCKKKKKKKNYKDY